MCSSLDDGTISLVSWSVMGGRSDSALPAREEKRLPSSCADMCCFMRGNAEALFN